ncbi:LysR family transcriptional regulator [Oceaniglobus trochenteri]|uniref:LysR family transcriptional regulator n=1 Tax=Oceaniglobus trochenteri TaxID=2763260 RepID=UPI001CFFB0EE|nr:LysR family transcriptional regulator [Oceaniglobus trochenteri]
MKKLTGLPQFVAVCATRNLTVAAQGLGVSQPALTQAIAKLERQLDVTLFDRSTRPMSLTPYGETLLDYAQKLEESTEALTDKLAEMKSGSGGLLRVGCGPDWIHEILPIAISALQQERPNVRVSLTVALNDDLRQKLDKGDIELFFASLTDDYFGSVYQSRILLREKMHILARTDHPIHQGPPKTLAHLAGQSWALTGYDTFGRQLLRRLFRQADVELPPPSVETNSVRAMINILRFSQKLGFLSRAHANAYPEIKVVRTVSEMPFREGGVVWRSDQPLLPLSERLLEQVKTVIRDRA